MLHFVCPHCDQRLTYESLPPRFCQHCGGPVSPVNSGSDSSPTVAPQRASSLPTADATVAPTLKPDCVDPIDQRGGQQVGPYRLSQWLGSGGMGSVWQAVDTRTGRRVALKRLSPSVATDAASVKRFGMEARLAARISHPHVTFIYATGKHDGLPYIAMELMPGRTLEHLVRDAGPLEVNEAVDHVLEVIVGLDAVHQKGTIHRDIKPSNCFLDSDGTVKIGDFGLSKSVETDVNLTKSGTFMGTPSYASPEQIRGVDVDPRADQYAVGATLFFLLTGRTPFVGDATSMMAQIIGDPPPSVRKFNAAVPKDLDRIIRKTLAKSPEDRFEDLSELRIALLPYTSRFNSAADAGRRLAAYMIDQSMLQIAGAVGVLATIVAISVIRRDGFPSAWQQPIRFWPMLILFAGTYLYYVIGEGRYGTTIGKRLMGLKLLDYRGQPAGLWRAAIRAALVPAGLGISMYLLWLDYRLGRLVQPTNPAEMIVVLGRGVALSFGPVLLCLVTMRRSNRLLGLHGMISGTRVVRAAQVAQQDQLPLVIQKPRPAEPMVFGPYATDRLLGECKQGQVYLARDDELNRDVWVVARPSGDPPPEGRLHLARQARQRWLDGGSCQTANRCLRWDAYEAVEGVPIQQFVGMIKHDRCYGFATLLRQLVHEMRASLEDQTLPHAVAVSQVWIDREGHIKLLDSRLIDPIRSSDFDFNTGLLTEKREPQDAPPVEQAVNLVQQVGDLLQRGRILPESLTAFLNALFQKPRDASTLTWSDRELAGLEVHATRLKWDDRLGILAVTMGIEALAFSLMGALIMLVCDYHVPVPLAYRAGWGVLASLMLPMGLAVYYRGGFVFRLMGIQVIGKDGKSAAPWIQALRAALSWAPFFLLGSAMLLLLFYAEAQQQGDLVTDPDSLAYHVTHDEDWRLVAVGTILASVVVIATGVLIAIFSPQRGLADRLLGTRLMPR